jgi:hypothetical protein
MRYAIAFDSLARELARSASVNVRRDDSFRWARERLLREASAGAGSGGGGLARRIESSVARSWVECSRRLRRSGNGQIEEQKEIERRKG